jgi:hypothetical protein
VKIDEAAEDGLDTTNAGILLEAPGGGPVLICKPAAMAEAGESR